MLRKSLEASGAGENGWELLARRVGKWTVRAFEMVYLSYRARGRCCRQEVFSGGRSVPLVVRCHEDVSTAKKKKAWDWPFAFFLDAFHHWEEQNKSCVKKLYVRVMFHISYGFRIEVGQVGRKKCVSPHDKIVPAHVGSVTRMTQLPTHMMVLSLWMQCSICLSGAA